jgi:hypothetical protein
MKLQNDQDNGHASTQEKIRIDCSKPIKFTVLREEWVNKN